ncbi:hypothetical protein AV530_007790 [Patagioenas fasciata monilis]|uniref:Uncharacterized protein n=1 Tax=Patagioenas fasciata monilis TaxID=372326 RepID=A0A1V4JTA5_PATFA|nr:hypothetical protein AV530_007790 [Patagioenas fasciata monilis]
MINSSAVTEMPTALANLPNWPYLCIPGSQGQAPFSSPHIHLPVIFFIQKRNSVIQKPAWPDFSAFVLCKYANLLQLSMLML